MVSVIITIVIIILAVFCPKDHVDDFRGVAAIIGVAVTFVTEVASNTATANIVVIVLHQSSSSAIVNHSHKIEIATITVLEGIKGYFLSEILSKKTLAGKKHILKRRGNII